VAGLPASTVALTGRSAYRSVASICSISDRLAGKRNPSARRFFRAAWRGAAARRASWATATAPWLLRVELPTRMDEIRTTPRWVDTRSENQQNAVNADPRANPSRSGRRRRGDHKDFKFSRGRWHTVINFQGRISISWARRFYEKYGWTLDDGARTETRRGIPFHEIRYRKNLQGCATGTSGSPDVGAGSRTPE
jgi:hypothetical protein